MVAHYTVRSVAAVCPYWTTLVVSNTAVHQEIPEAFFTMFWYTSQVHIQSHLYLEAKKMKSFPMHRPSDRVRLKKCKFCEICRADYAIRKANYAIFFSEILSLFFKVSG